MTGKSRIQKKRLKVKERLKFQMTMMHTIRRSPGLVSESKVEEMQGLVRGRGLSLPLLEEEKVGYQMMRFLLRIQRMIVMRILGQKEVLISAKTATLGEKTRLALLPGQFARFHMLKVRKVKKLMKGKIKSLRF